MPNDTVTEGSELVASGSSLDIINRGEYDIQIATAHKYPRSVKSFRDQALQLATLNEAIAQECNYALPRKDKNGQVKTIEGPSIRFAEIVGSCWGNAHVGTRVINDDGEFITAQAVFHDLERNWKVVEEVQRRVTDSKGRRYSADMIGVTANAARSIAMRNAVLHGVPKAFWEDIRLRARHVAAGNVTTLATKRLEAVKSFAVYGVTEAQILAMLGRPGMEDVTIDDLSTLFGILTAVKDGEVTPEEAFAVRADAEPIPMPKARSDEHTGRTGFAVGSGGAGAGGEGAAGEIEQPKPTMGGPDPAPLKSDAEAVGAKDGADLVDAAIAGDPMAMKRLATKAQREMVLAVASKHKNLTPEQLDVFLSDKFAITVATLPMALVNDVLKFVSEMRSA